MSVMHDNVHFYDLSQKLHMTRGACTQRRLQKPAQQHWCAEAIQEEHTPHLSRDLPCPAVGLSEGTRLSPIHHRSSGKHKRQSATKPSCTVQAPPAECFLAPKHLTTNAASNWPQEGHQIHLNKRNCAPGAESVL